MNRCVVIGLAVLAAGLCARPAGAQDKVSPEEAKAAAELKKGATDVTVDEKHPDKPVIGLGYYARTIDEKTAALLKDMKHLKRLGGYDVKFAPGVLKLLKDHPTLDTIAFSGSTDLAALKELPDGPPIKELFLGDGQFTVEHFGAIAKVPSIRTVSIYLARIKPEILRPLHKLKNLESLSAPTDEPFSAEDVSGFRSLVQLTCVAPNDSAPFFEALAKMKTLRKLTLLPQYVGGNPPTTPPAGLAKLAALTDLTNLTLGFPVGDANLTALATLKNLTQLNADATGMKATGMKALAGLPKLTSLRLSGKELPEAAAVELKGLSGLKELDLSVGPLTEDGMKAVGSMTGLESLKLGNSHRGADKAMPHVAKLAKLRSLDLTFTDLTDAGLKELGGMKALTELKVGGTKTTPAGHAALQKALPKVKIITSFTTGPY